MATIDPRIQGIQAGGAPGLSGPPDTLSPLAAGAAAGHLANIFLSKRDTNAHNRGIDAAKAHIIEGQGHIEKYKAKNILLDTFDADFINEVNTHLAKVKTKNQYEPSNETEQLAYDSTLAGYKQNLFHTSIGESIKAVKEHNINILSSNLETFKDAYVATPGSESAQIIANQMFKSLYEGSRMDRENPGVISQDMSRIKYEKDLREATVSRHMRHMTNQELFEYGNDPKASITIPNPDTANWELGTPPTSIKTIPLSNAERQSMVEFALKRWDQEDSREKKIHSISKEKTTIQKAGVSREFYDGVIATKGVMGLELLAKAQDMHRDDGSPLFEGAEIKEMNEYIRTTIDNHAQGPKVSDPGTYAKFYNQIYPVNKDGGVNYSAHPLPSILSIASNSRLTQTHKDQLVSAITSERTHRTNRDFTDFATKRSEGHALLKSALGGEAMIELSEDTKNFFGELQNAYYSRIGSAYDRALQQGEGLRGVNPQSIVNQLIMERLPAMDNIFFRDATKQMKALAGHAAKLSKSISNESDLSPLVTILSGATGSHMTEENVRLLALTQALQRKGKTIGDLRAAVAAGTELNMILDAPQSGGTGFDLKSNLDRIKKRQGK